MGGGIQVNAEAIPALKRHGHSGASSQTGIDSSIIRRFSDRISPNARRLLRGSLSCPWTMRSLRRGWLLSGRGKNHCDLPTRQHLPTVRSGHV